MTHLGRQGLEDIGALAGRIDPGRGQVQRWCFRNGGPIPSQGRKATVQNDAVTHSRNSFSRIAVPMKKTISEILNKVRLDVSLAKSEGIIYQGTLRLKAFKEDFDAKELEDTLIMLLC